MDNFFRTKFFTSNNGKYKFARTVVQAGLGYIVNNITMIVASTNFDATTQTIIVAASMAILAPVMDKLAMKDEKARDNNA